LGHDDPQTELPGERHGVVFNILSFPEMKIELFRGVIKDACGSQIEAWCARTPFGIRAVPVDEGSAEIRIADPQQTSVLEVVTTIDVAGLDRDSLEFLVDTILQKGYLARNGVIGKGDAVLFLVTNDALQALEQIRSWEIQDNEDS